jgi:putative endonuclease
MSQHNKDTGFLGENKAASYLISMGYTILFRNWRYKHLEVDIIASKDHGYG